MNRGSGIIIPAITIGKYAISFFVYSSSDRDNINAFQPIIAINVDDNGIILLNIRMDKLICVAGSVFTDSVKDSHMTLKRFMYVFFLLSRIIGGIINKKNRKIFNF